MTLDEMINKTFVKEFANFNGHNTPIYKCKYCGLYLKSTRRELHLTEKHNEHYIKIYDRYKITKELTEKYNENH